MSSGRQQKARELLEEALRGVRAELSRAELGQEALDSKEALAFIAGGLATMLAALEQDPSERAAAPGLWRIVSDTWPYTAPLRELIVAAEFEYEKAS